MLNGLANWRQRETFGPLKMGRDLSGTASCSLLIKEVEERICLFAVDKGTQKKLEITEDFRQTGWRRISMKFSKGQIQGWRLTQRESTLQRLDEDSGGAVPEEQQKLSTRQQCFQYYSKTTKHWQSNSLKNTWNHPDLRRKDLNWAY